MTTKPITFSTRERFNWGYHDGANDRIKQRAPRWYAPNKPHPLDRKAYGAGYEAGYNDARNSNYHEDSSAAWMARKAD